MISITSTPRKVEDVRTTGVPMVMVVIYQSALASQPKHNTQTQLPVSKMSTGNLEHRPEHLHIEARQTHERQSRSSLRATCHDQYARRTALALAASHSNSHSPGSPLLSQAP